MKPKRVFVYGTLMSGLHNHHLVKPYLKKSEPGKTVGILFDLPYVYPAIIPGNGTVYGEVMELRDVCEALKVLDRLEGYHGTGGPRNLYNRVIQEVETSGGEKVLAYLYIWGRPEELRDLGNVVPGGDWRDFKSLKGGKKMSKYYFAYGSCMDYEGRIKGSDYAREFEMVGIGRLEGYRFCMNKRAADGINVFANIVCAPESSVYGVLYRVSQRAEKNYLDVREGFRLNPRHYDKEYGKVAVGGREYADVMFYVAAQDFICREVRPTTQKYELELKRGCAQLPDAYRTEFLAEIARCSGERQKINNETNVTEQEVYLYHDHGQVTAFMRQNPEFYKLVREMTIYFGDSNEKVNASGVTPEMFRILVKLTEMASRGELDLGHMIPRGLLERLRSEFVRIKG